MIKFFRKIRYKLLGENRTRKYLKYALGEILLVVIGILIALQINNWNDQRKLKQVTTNYYEQILIDFDKEQQNIDSLLVFLENSISSYNRYKETFKDSTSSSRETLYALFGVQYVYPNLKFNTNTIKTLETTGEIKHITPNIRERLINLQRNFENMQEMTKTNNRQYLDALMRAGELGLNDLGRRLQYQEELQKQVEAEYNLAKLIITADGAYRLKNFTEKELQNELSSRLTEISTLQELISQEIKK